MLFDGNYAKSAQKFMYNYSFLCIFITIFAKPIDLYIFYVIITTIINIQEGE